MGEGRLKKFAQNIAFIVALGIGAMGVAYFYVITFIFEVQPYRQVVIDEVKKMTGRELVIGGPLDFSSFPTPRFVVNDVKLKNLPGTKNENIISIESIEAKVSFISLLFSSVKINGFILNSPVVELENFVDAYPNWKDADFVGPPVEYKNKDKNNIIGLISAGTLELKDLKVVYHSGQSKNPLKREFLFPETVIEEDSIVGPYNIEGVFKASDELALDYVVATGNFSEAKTPIKFTLKTKNTKFELDGNYENSYFTGNLVSSVGQSLNEILNYIGVEGSPLASLVLNKPAEAKSEVIITSEGIGLQNLKINSEKINGEGALQFIFGRIAEIRTAMKFDNIEISSVAATEKEKIADDDKNDESEEEKGISPLLLKNDFTKPEKIEKERAAGRYINFKMPQDLNAKLDVLITKIVYNGQAASDVRMRAEAAADGFKVYSLTAANMPGESLAEFSGTIAEEGDIQKISGALRGSGKSFPPLAKWLGIDISDFKEGNFNDFSGEVAFSVSPKNIYLQKIDVNFDGGNLIGQMVYDIGEKAGSLKASLKATKFNLDSYLRDDAKTDISAKLDSLRKIDFAFERIAIAFAADELTYMKKDFSNISGALFIGGGKTNLQNLSITAEGGTISGNIAMDTNQLNPIINADLNITKIDSKLIWDMLANDLVDGFAPSVADEVVPSAADLAALANSTPSGEKPSPKIVWSQKRFELEQAGVFTGAVKAYIGEFTHNRVKMNDIRLQLGLSENRINITTFLAKVFDSSIDIKGTFSYGSEVPSLKMTFNSANANLSMMLEELFGFRAVTAGKVGYNGSLAMSGYSIDEWVQNMQGSASIIARTVMVNGFDLGLLVRKVPALARIDDVRYWANQALSTGKTPFDYVSGSMAFSGGTINFQNFSMQQKSSKQSILYGNIDLPNWQSNLKVDMNLFAGEGGDIPVKMTMSGDMDNIFPYWDKAGIEKNWETRFYGGSR